jgi:hypothetical protein
MMFIGMFCFAAVVSSCKKNTTANHSAIMAIKQPFAKKCCLKTPDRFSKFKEQVIPAYKASIKK